MNITNKEIEMIAYFKAGEIKPLRFRIETEDGIYVIKIKNSVEKQRNEIYIAFMCSFIFNSEKHYAEIRYDINDMNWIVYIAE